MFSKLAAFGLSLFAWTVSAQAETVTVELKKSVNTEVVTYAQVKSVLTSCTACHQGTTPASGLNLSAFPFTSTRMTTQPQIVDQMITRVSMTTGRMPPSSMPALTEAQINLIKAWRAADLPAGPVMKYETIVKVIAADGSVRGSQVFSANGNPFDAGFTYQLDFAP